MASSDFFDVLTSFFDTKQSIGKIRKTGYIGIPTNNVIKDTLILTYLFTERFADYP
ncbi:MAG: hypothetical protein H6Q17_1602 [Bacteroidetes bacterium]|jgi:hypothetical protein|nr:hypothetical protein [Bacteroidota bacterium]